MAALVLLTSGWVAPSGAAPVTLLDRQRFGVVATSDNWREKFDSAQLGAGWVVDFDYPACASRPGGLDRAIGLSLRTFSSVNPEKLGPFVDAHPGSVWLVGNEPDHIYQDNALPEQYAYLYHDLYSFIKDRDPTSLVAAGGIVQATPLRLEWLDRVLEAYRQSYGSEMPVDIWQIHNAIVNEKRGEWGAGIPPGIDAEEGRMLSPDDNDNMDIFRQQILDFRQWMSDNGYRDRPLVITEFGVLMPEERGFDAARVNSFMSSAFDYLQTATDETLGYSSDDNRLVQRWAWFSLDFPPYDPVEGRGFNGNLFDPDTREITAVGLHFAQLLKRLPALGHVELVIGGVTVSPLSVPIPVGETVTRTVAVEVLNLGNQGAGAYYVLLELEGPVSRIVEQQVAGLGAGERIEVSFALPDLPPGAYHIAVQLDSRENVLESDECNNRFEKGFLFPSHMICLPIVTR
jgi:hypothetical protein